MTVVIVGADRVGTRLAKTLIAENMNVIMFEQDMEKANLASNSLDCLVINKDGLDPENLREAGVSKADYFISLTGSDERNMIACGLVNREFNTPNKIASVHNITFTHTSLLEKSFLGIDYIVNPELEAAKVPPSPPTTTPEFGTGRSAKAPLRQPPSNPTYHPK